MTFTAREARRDRVLGRERLRRLGGARRTSPSYSFTPFQVTSASQGALAAALARLEERGLIDVNAPVRRYLPDFVAPA